MSRQRSYADRRTYLKIVGTAAIASIAGCHGNNPGEGANHEVPHPNGDEVPDAEATGTSLGGETRPKDEMFEKRSTSFNHKPEEGEYCGMCQHYVPDEDGDGFGACTEVQGKIHPCDHCGRFDKYEGDDTVPCEA